MISISGNGVLLSIEHLPGHKRPSLTVRLKNEPTTIYVVASFNSEANATWTAEMIEEMFAKHPEAKEKQE